MLNEVKHLGTDEDTFRYAEMLQVRWRSAA
jgi:hypothetical protein